MQVLEDLYIGNIHPSERGYKNDSQYGKALEEAVKYDRSPDVFLVA